MAGYEYAVIQPNKQPKHWYVYYNLNDNAVKDDPDITDIKAKLASRAKPAGLLGCADVTKATKPSSYVSQNYALLQVR